MARRGLMTSPASPQAGAAYLPRLRDGLSRRPERRYMLDNLPIKEAPRKASTVAMPARSGRRQTPAGEWPANQ